MNDVARGATIACELDHLVVGAHTLEQGAAFIEDLLGVRPQTGGRHLAMGTHNMVLRLGARAYLEVMAIDPAGEKPQRPRWFGLDDKLIQEQLREGPRLLTWAIRTQDIENAVKNCPVAPGTIHPMTRGAYTWRITIPDDGELICDGLLPTLIQWDCATHPAENLEDRGCELMKLGGAHPAPASIAPALAALGLGQTISLTQAHHARLTATIRSPHGMRVIAS
jgi:hypothetical protein